MSFSKLNAALAKSGLNSAEDREPPYYISTGYPPLDHEISGRYVGPKAGVAGGRIVEMYGPPAAGKTFLATNMMINVQQAGGIAVFFDHEHAYQQEIGEKFGLITSEPEFLYYRPRTFEAAIDMAVKLMTLIRESGEIADDAPVLMVFDSLAAMVPNSKVEFSEKGFNMHDNTALARCTSASFPGLATLASELNTTLVFLNQARTNIATTHGDPTTSPGGDAPKFYSSVRLKLSKVKGTKGDQALKAKVVKNKTWKPGGECEWELAHEDDGSIRVLTVLGTLQAAAKAGIIESSGAYYTWTDGKKYHPGPLAAKIESEGLYPDLLAMMEGKGAVERGKSDDE